LCAVRPTTPRCQPTATPGKLIVVDSTVWAAIIGGVVSVLLFISGGAASVWKDRAAGREAAQKEGRAAVEALVGAVVDMQVLLASMDARRRDWRAIYPVVALAVTQMLAGHAAGRPLEGSADGLRSALAWRRGIDAPEEARASAAITQFSAAAAKAAMLDSQDLRTAARDVIDATEELMALGAARPSSRARRQAEEKVKTAVGRLADAGRAYDGRLRPAWWRRVGAWVRMRVFRRGR
jgi:hypothetical protein